MKTFSLGLLLLILIPACKKYRVIHIGCLENVGGLNCYTPGFAPSLFTPNGDGNNDVYMLFRSDSIPPTSFHIVIKNALGAKVFESNDVNFLWDGTNKGKPVKSDVYKVWMTMKCPNMDRELSSKGAVTLYRDDFKNFCPENFDHCQLGAQWDGFAYNALLPSNEFLNYGDCN